MTSSPMENHNLSLNSPQQMLVQVPSHVSLYVGNLDTGLSEQQLFEIFKPFGQIMSISVKRDPITRRSLGYAFITFVNFEQATTATEQLNCTMIMGKPCRIMPAEHDPSQRHVGKTNILIKNLDKTIDDRSLLDTFSQFGKVVSCKIERDIQGISKGFAYIMFESEEDAAIAIENIDGMLLKSSKVFVCHHEHHRSRTSKSGEKMEKQSNIFVKNLDFSVDEEELTKLFEKCGPIVSIFIQKDDNGVSKGFGFVNFENHEAAFRAIEELDGFELKGKCIAVRVHQTKAARERELTQKYEQVKLERLNNTQGTNLYVKNIDLNFTDEQLLKVFSPFGDITSAKVMRDEKTKASKGFGFVCFSTPDEASKAMKMNGHFIGSKPLYVAFAQPKNVRQAQLRAQMTPHESIPWNMSASGYMAPVSSVPVDLEQNSIPAQPITRMAPVVDVNHSEDIETRRQALGNKLYPLVEAQAPGRGGKITGMFLFDLDIAELVSLLENPEELKLRVDEARSALIEHEKQQ